MTSPAPPAVSILLPTWNGEAHLAAQLDSILGQSFGDFELLVVDDGSSDGTPALLEAYAARDARIRLLPSGGNKGQKERLWELALAARAPLLSIADQDDVWDRERTAALVRGLGDKAMSYGRSELIDASGAPLGRNLIENFGAPPDPSDRLALLFVPRVSGHASLVRRKAVTETAFRRFAPFDWLLALDALFSDGLVYVDEAVVHHRLHGGNQSNAGVASRPSPLQRLRPGRIYAELQSTRRRRYNFLSRIEHLGHSPVIRDEHRRLFARLAERCRWAWFQPGTGSPFVDRRLRRELEEALRPLAGSERDWAVAADHIWGLTRAQAHPASLYQSAKLLFWY
jgi:glycosyltransferase involved in cell wall biosynthesis